MGKCGDCKYWKRREKDDYSAWETPTDESMRYGDCSSPKFVYEFNYTQDADELLYRDYEDYMAKVVTGQNFGCIHFDAR